MKKLFTLIFILFLSTVNSQEGLGVLTDNVQQAMIDFGNRSPKIAQPLNVQGSHYFDKDFKVAKLEYFGKELNDTGYMRYNAFRDEIEMADTQYQKETDVILLKSADVIPLINGDRYEYLPYRLESGNAYIGYLVNIFNGENNKLY
jgi:hypothetical protein